MMYRESTRSVCDDNWSPAISQVCCSELYGDPEYIRYVVAVRVPYTGFWIELLANSCQGFEPNL